MYLSKTISVDNSIHQRQNSKQNIKMKYFPHFYNFVKCVFRKFQWCGIKSHILSIFNVYNAFYLMAIKNGIFDSFHIYSNFSFFTFPFLHFLFLYFLFLHFLFLHFFTFSFFCIFFFLHFLQFYTFFFEQIVKAQNDYSLIDIVFNRRKSFHSPTYIVLTICCLRNPYWNRDVAPFRLRGCGHAVDSVGRCKMLRNRLLS